MFVIIIIIISLIFRYNIFPREVYTGFIILLILSFSDGFEIRRKKYFYENMEGKIEERKHMFYVLVPRPVFWALLGISLRFVCFTRSKAWLFS